MATVTRAEFLADPQGRRFADVVDRDRRVDFDAWLAFFNDPVRQQRMQDAESAHGRPALAGVVKELEEHSAFKSYLADNDAHTTWRGRQAIGVLVCVVMQKLGWRKTGVKGSLGSRKATKPHTTTPGAYQNKSGISKWFTKAEHYILPPNPNSPS